MATRTGTAERYVREWLASQAAGGYVEFQPAFDRYSLNDAQAACLTGPGGIYDLTGAYHVVEYLFRVKQCALEAYRTGGRLP